jgi:hypothetical protein
VTRIEGQALVHCFGGCGTQAVLDALGMTMRDLFDDPSGAEYQYDNGRRVYRSPTKKFRQTGNTRGKAQLYRLAAATNAVRNNRTVAVVEGEKDVHALESLGVVATTNPMGASNWHKVDASPLYGADVVVIPDADEAGQRWASSVRSTLDGKCKSLTFLAPKEGKDPADHVAAGYGFDEFLPLELGADSAYERTDSELTRRLRLTPASAIKPRIVRWIWDTASADAPPEARQGRFPEGSLVLAAGRAGLGKSQFAIWLTARITTGTLPGARWGQPRPVVYAASEDSWSMTIVPRLIAAEANLELVFRVDVEADDDQHAQLTLPRDTPLLERELEANGVALVILDPLLSIIDQGLNDYRAREVREALEPIVAVADRTRATIVGLAHFTKASGSDPLMLISGSGAFGQLVRAAVGFARDEDGDGTYVMSTIKNNLGRENLPSLTYVIDPQSVDTPEGQTWMSRLRFTGEESERSVRDLLRDRAVDQIDRGERYEAEQWLVDYLTACGGTARAGDVIKAAARDGIAKTTLTRARQQAGIDTIKTSMAGGWNWTLSKATRRDPEESEASTSRT